MSKSFTSKFEVFDKVRVEDIDEPMYVTDVVERSDGVYTYSLENDNGTVVLDSCSEDSLSPPELPRFLEEDTRVPPNLKLLVIGTGRHGKDTVCEYLADKYKLPFQSSSEYMSEMFYPFLKDILGYTSPEECYADRHNCRALWYELISAYNRKDPTTLARGVLESNNIYCGMRSKIEVDACKQAGVFDLVIWVDASDRVDYQEDESSCNVSKNDADIVITNNGTLEELYAKVDKLMKLIGSDV